jgi:phage FluMu protein gp41
MSNRIERGFQTEVEFVLPRGYLDAQSVLHRRGVMRLATAADEILPLRDPRVQQNPAYLAIIVLARVITKLGDVQDIDTKTIEGLYATDLDYLQRLYERINSVEETDVAPTQSAPGRSSEWTGSGAGPLQNGTAALQNGAAPLKGFRAAGEV